MTTSSGHLGQDHWWGDCTLSLLKFTNIKPNANETEKYYPRYKRIILHKTYTMNGVMKQENFNGQHIYTYIPSQSKADLFFNHSCLIVGHKHYWRDKRPTSSSLYTVKPRPPGAMRLRTRGHQFELPAVKYEFNKRNFIVRSLFNYI